MASPAQRSPSTEASAPASRADPRGRAADSCGGRNPGARRRGTSGFTAPDQLLRVPVPPAPENFEAFWRDRYARPAWYPRGRSSARWRRSATACASTASRTPPWAACGSAAGSRCPPRGRCGTDSSSATGTAAARSRARALPPRLAGSAAILPCVRGDGGAGPGDGIPDLAAGHVLHGIGSRSTYVVDDCAADWDGAQAAGDRGLAGKRWHPRRPHTVTPRMASPRNTRRVNMRASQPWDRIGRSDRREF